MPGRMHNERVFRDYLQRLPDSVGKRFLVIHLDRCGMEAVEAFWDKMRAAFIRGDREIALTPDEARSLAETLASGISRRRWIGLSVAGILATIGANDMGNALMGSSLRHPLCYARDAAMFAIGLNMATVGAALGIGVEAWYRQNFKDLTTGAMGEENIGQLVRALDQLFLPVEIAAAETGIMQKRDSSRHARG
ncbi:MAG: hypothetical protein KGJ06_08650 [Pseudomonadota bacterium]|nr:hypothetical protein [Pseudomonadota bacterium]